jgi:hypothetical protein
MVIKVYGYQSDYRKEKAPISILGLENILGVAPQGLEASDEKSLRFP